MNECLIFLVQINSTVFIGTEFIHTHPPTVMIGVVITILYHIDTLFAFGRHPPFFSVKCQPIFMYYSKQMNGVLQYCINKHRTCLMCIIFIHTPP